METLEAYVEKYGAYLGPIKFLEDYPEQRDYYIFIDLEELILNH